MQRYERHTDRAKTPVREKIHGREAEMAPNSDGRGVAFLLDDWKRLDRFLILGSDTPTYYATARKLSFENVECVKRCVQADPARVVARIVEISDSGRAMNNDPALYALAVCASAGIGQTPDEHAGVRRAAMDALSQVARTGTHLFHFVQYAQSMRGWGRGMRDAIKRWYGNRSARSMAMQVAKYQSRDGWSHRDVLRKGHPQMPSPHHNAAASWATSGRLEEGSAASGVAPILLLERCKTASERELVDLIGTGDVPMEFIPTDKRSPAVYEALLPHSGLGWVLRNLGNLGKHGILATGQFENLRMLSQRLLDAEALRAQRVHPMDVLKALCIYKQGHSDKGKGSWSVVPQVLDALSDAFPLSFGTVTPIKGRVLYAVDSSGSMGGYWSGGLSNFPRLSPCQAAAVLAYVMLQTEDDFVPIGFDTRVHQVELRKRMSLVELVEGWDCPGGATNLGLPVEWAQANNLAVDTFVILTDNEANTGRHASTLLANYRKKMQVPQAKMAVVGMTSTGFTIADPKDPGMMDFVGFDAQMPNLINAFGRGEL
jgi:60 kDa SS-A/Ro ribonucleoprotein